MSLGAGGTSPSHLTSTNEFSFYINLPIGAVTIVTIAFLLPVPHQPLKALPLKEKIAELDLLGAFFFLPYPALDVKCPNCSATVCFLLALQWGGTVHPWNSSVIIGLFVGFGLMMGTFIGLQFYRGDKATLPPSVLKQRSVASAGLFNFFMGASIFILIYYSISLGGSYIDV